MSGDHVRSAAGRDRRSLVIVLGMSLTILVVEVVGGIASDSLALLADAGHVFTDVAGLLLALGAIWLAGPAGQSDARTFGWYRAEILAAALNAVLLFAIAAFVLVEAWRRLSEPPEIASGLMLAVALVGGAVNLVSLRILRGPQARSLNMRGAYLEVLGDLLGSVAVVVAAVVIVADGLHDRPMPSRRRSSASSSCRGPGTCSARPSTSCSRRPPRAWTSTRSASASAGRPGRGGHP